MPQLDELYREVVLDHYRHPRGHEPVESPNFCSEGFNPTCGDQVRLAVALDEGRIDELEVRCQGCSISVASGSMMAELLRGRTEAEVLELAVQFKSMMHGKPIAPEVELGDLEALQGVAKFPVRIKCALLAWTTLQEALERLRAEREKGAAGPMAV